MVPDRDAMLDLAVGVKRFRTAAKRWTKDHRYIPRLDNNCRFIIDLFNFLEESRSLSGEEAGLRAEARVQLAGSVARVAACWKQCGKFQAVKEGDKNTGFFHARAS